MKKLIGSTIALLFSIIACDTSSGQSKNAELDNNPMRKITPAKNTFSNTSVKVPKFKDADIQAYFNWYGNLVEKNLRAVRSNDNAAIKVLFGEAILKTDEGLVLVEKASNGGAEELKKVQDFTLQITPMMKEVSRSIIFQRLTKEYLQKGNKSIIFQRK